MGAPTNSTEHRALREARVVARISDDLVRVPGTQQQVGLDPLLGLLPGVGDWLGWAASAHLLIAAARMGAPAAVILRMTGNALLDAIVGTVPFLGDLFDFGWKANRRNLQLLERLAADPEPTVRASRFLLGAVLLSTLAVTVGTSVAAVLVFRWMLALVGLSS